MHPLTLRCRRWRKNSRQHTVAAAAAAGGGGSWWLRRRDAARWWLRSWWLRNDTMSRSQRRCKASLTTGQREVEYAMPEDKDLLQMSHPRAAQPRGRQPLSVVLRRICSTLSRSPYTPDRLMGLARGAPSSALLSASPTKLRGTCRRLCRGRTCHR
ncbi:hypothetical protein BHM03_00016452 [Ensete ventricosum]|nr:hypothetical protein BHM03_00016452 [Ensete ventricosum]